MWPLDIYMYMRRSYRSVKLANSPKSLSNAGQLQDSSLRFSVVSLAMEYQYLEIPEPNSDLKLHTKILPSVPNRGALVEVHFSGVCHSDLHLWEGFYQLGNGKRISFAERPGYSYPLVPGHEVAGIVKSLGKDCSAAGSCCVAIGDRVAVYSFLGCGECAACLAGINNNCPRALQRGLGFQYAGGLASHLVVPDAKFLVKVPESVDMRCAALATCGGITAQTAVNKAIAPVKTAIELEGQGRVLIVGAGGLGLWAVQLAKVVLGHLGPVRIVCTDIKEDKLTDARACGADATVLWVDSGSAADREPSPSGTDQQRCGATSSDEAPSSQELELIKACGGPPHAVLDFVGSTKTTGRALQCLAQSGTLCVVGLFGGSLSIQLPLLVLRNHCIVGVHAGTLDDLSGLIQLLDEKQIMAPKFEEFAFDQAENVLRKMQKGALSGRAVLRVKP